MGAVASSCENCFGDKTDPRKSRLNPSVPPRKTNYHELKTENHAAYNESRTAVESLKSLNTYVKSGNNRQKSKRPGLRSNPSEDFTMNKNKKITAEDFNFIRVIGRGAFGKVFLVQKKDNKKYYALKTLKKHNIVKGDYVDQALTERNVLQNSSHPFLTKLHYSFQNETTLFFVMDFCPGGELFTQLIEKGRFDEETARFYAAEVVLGLQHLHENFVIYRDLKPKNILLDGGGHVKITDFGLSKVAKKAYTICGTAEYCAPEIFRNEGYDKTVDWWSLGCMIYEMLVGHPPFSSKDRTQLEKEILNDEAVIVNFLSSDAKDLISRLLAKNPSKRLGFKGTEEVKAHPFFTSINWDNLLALKIQPPFVPMLTRSTDLRYFKKEIVQEPVAQTPTAASQKHSDSKNPFQNFTYVPKDGALNEPNLLLANH